jgi:hypothetical protein
MEKLEASGSLSSSGGRIINSGNNNNIILSAGSSTTTAAALPLRWKVRFASSPSGVSGNDKSTSEDHPTTTTTAVFDEHALCAVVDPSQLPRHPSMSGSATTTTTANSSSSSEVDATARPSRHNNNNNNNNNNKKQPQQGMNRNGGGKQQQQPQHDQLPKVTATKKTAAASKFTKRQPQPRGTATTDSSSRVIKLKLLTGTLFMYHRGTHRRVEFVRRV